MAIIIENDSMNPNDKLLLERVIDLGEMFKDMRFTKDSLTYECINDMIPDALVNFDYHHFVYHVEPLDKCDGMFDEDTQTLSISPDALGRDDIILHEMIYMYEQILKRLPSYKFRDLFIWTLYSSLKSQIPELVYMPPAEPHVHGKRTAPLPLK